MSEGQTYKQQMDALQCVVIIPTYNNAGTVCSVISDVKEYSDHIIVVNDGSTDDTRTLINNIPGITVIDYAKNMGKGHALAKGIRKAIELGYRYAITIDSDGQHFADDIPVFIKRISEVPDSLLIGARNLKADNMPSKNTFANRFSNFWYKVETGMTLSDTQSGYRLYPLDRIKKIHTITSGYEFEVEIIVRSAWCGINVENVPVKVYYAPKGERVSHFKPFKDFTRISILNTVLVLIAFLVYYPWRFLKALTFSNIRKFIDENVIHSEESNLKMSLAMGWGIFCGIIPIWGYQMIFAGLTAHLMKLNKLIAVVFSNISIPPMIPFILYGSMVSGALLLDIENSFGFDDFSLENVGVALGQYVVGSIALAAVSGLTVFLVSYFIMSVCKRNT